MACESATAAFRELVDFAGLMVRIGDMDDLPAPVPPSGGQLEKDGEADHRGEKDREQHVRCFLAIPTSKALGWAQPQFV